MSYEIGYSKYHKRDIGYGVPAVCDHAGCTNEINRGMDYLCEDCELFFCSEHQTEECNHDTCVPSADVMEWVDFKLTHESWKEWREDNPEFVKRYSTFPPGSLGDKKIQIEEGWEDLKEKMK